MFTIKKEAPLEDYLLFAQQKLCMNVVELATELNNTPARYEGLLRGLSVFLVNIDVFPLRKK